jgi:tetratricopeptide (TPR) repeat protein
MDDASLQHERTTTPGGSPSVVKKLLWATGGVSLLIGGATMGIVIEQTRSRATPVDSSEVADIRPHEPEQAPSDTPELDLPDSETLSPSHASRLTQVPEPIPSLLDDIDFPSSPVADGPASHPDPARVLEHDLSRADAFIQEGNYVAALRQYLPMLENVSGVVMRSQILLRIALCQEALGETQESQSHYRRVVELYPPRPMLEAALLGQARVWQASGREELAVSTLLRTLLELPREVDDQGRAQLPHQLGTLLSGNIERASRTGMNVLDDRVLTAPRQMLRPERLVREWADGRTDLDFSSEGESDGERLDVTQRFSSSPDEIFLTVRGNRANAWHMLTAVARTAGWTVHATDAARQRLNEHTVSPDCTDLPFSLILDALLVPHQLTWTTEEEQIVIQPVSDLPPSERRSREIGTARRTLRFACTHAPEHAWAPLSYMELGRLADVKAKLRSDESDESDSPEGVEQAVQDYLHAIDQYPRSEHVPEAWFNIGKLRLQQGDLEQALTAFHRAVDSMPGHPLEAAAYLYVGRIHLETGNFRNGVMPLIRGLSLAEGTELEGTAALLLASAYHLLENPTRANTVLIDHRPALHGPATRDPAAFLAGLIRFQNTREPRIKNREGGTLIASLTNLKPNEQFGKHWWYLAIVASQETGMIPQAHALFARCLDQTYPFPLQDRMRSVMLAGGLFAGEDDGSPETTDREILAQARLMQAAAAFRNEDFLLTLELTRGLLEIENLPDEHRREALGLMGRVYQLQGDHRLAIRCFTGLVPEESPPVSERGRTSSTGGER